MSAKKEKYSKHPLCVAIPNLLKKLSHILIVHLSVNFVFQNSKI